jgi:CBS domain-containing protein
MKTPDETITIQVRTRRTFSGTGESEIATSVPCPLREHPTTAEGCEQCARSVEIGIGRAGPTHVRCRIPREDRPAPEDVASGPARAWPRAQTQWQSAADTTPVAALMHTDVLCAAPDLHVAVLARLLSARRISGVPVVDERGFPVGVVSKSDLVEVFRTRRDLVVGDIMMSVAFTLREDASIAQAAALMAVEDVHRVPIVAADGTVVGIVAALDILRWMAIEDGYIDPDISSG